MAQHVNFRLKEGTGDAQREAIIGDLHERFAVSLGGTDPYGAIPVDAGKLEEIADFLRGCEGVDAASVKIE